MKRAKKIIAVFLGVLLLISCLTATVFAAETNTQDGLTAVIQTDKENYSANEDIHITVTVTNNNSFEVKNVSIESFLPDTLTLKDGDLKSKTLDLQSGETLTLACVVILEKEEQSSSENETSEPTTEETTTEITETTETATETTEQITDETSTAPDTTTSETEESNSETETDDILPIEPSTNESNPDATTESVSQESNPTSPDTGDNSPFVKLLIALIIAMAIIAAYIIITKKNNKKATKVISLILCSAIAISSVATIGFIKVGAEESNTQNFTVDKTITVDGRNYTINVNVSYDKTKEVSDTWYQGVDEDHVVTSDSGIKYINNRIIIMFYSETTDEQKQNIISSVNGKIIGINEYGTEYQIEINPTLDLEELRNICHNVSVMNGVRHCYYETVFDPEDLISTVPNDPWEDTFNGILGTDWDENSPGGLNWWLETVEAPSAWEYNKRFNNIKIGIVDNGFDTNHEDLDLTVINPYENSNSGDEAPDHGTHVAGIIGATANNNVGITGMVWNKELYCADVLATKHQKENHISILSIYDGIQKLLEKGCKVVNMSIGKNPPLTEDNDILEQGKTATSKILEWREQLKRDDFIIVQSAGNDGVDSVQNGFFSSITVNGIDEYFSEHKKEAEKYNRYDVFTHFIIVGAIEQDDNKYKLCEENKNPFDLYDFNSNYGYGISIVAPGKKIFSCSQMGGLNGDYIYSSGTSMAAPIVTGVAALVWSVNPNFNAEEVNRIVCTSYNKTAVSSNENDSRSSYPIVNAKLAVEKAVNMTYNVGTATGAFIDSENGSPVSNVYMECVRYTGNIKDVNLSDFNIWVEDNIFYQELYEGTYEYKISVDGYTYNDTVLFDVQKGKTTDVGTIKLFKLNGNVTGVVKDKVTDAPISDVTLEVIDNSAGNFETIATTTTNENGGFSLNLPAGSYSVSFNHPAYVYQGISVDIEKDATTVIMEPVYLTPKNTENPEEPGIPDTAVEFNGHYYQVYDTPMTWNEAKAYCESLDGHLVTITSGAEQEFVETLIANGKKKSYWLGGTDAANEGTWEWITGEKFDYTNWREFMPDNWQNEDYLMMYKEMDPSYTGETFGRWNDLKSDGTCPGNSYFSKDIFGFICEWDTNVKPTGTCITKMEIVDHGQYTGNQGDSRVFHLDKSGLSGNDNRYYRNGNIGLDGTEYNDGLEVWIARWNFTEEVSWAYATYKLDGKYTRLTGKTSLIKSANTDNFDTTIYFYDGDTLLQSYTLTNEDYEKQIDVDVSGVNQLKILVQDNKAVKRGTSFALYDMFLK